MLPSWFVFLILVKPYISMLSIHKLSFTSITSCFHENGAWGQMQSRYWKQLAVWTRPAGILQRATRSKTLLHTSDWLESPRSLWRAVSNDPWGVWSHVWTLHRTFRPSFHVVSAAIWTPERNVSLSADALRWWLHFSLEEKQGEGR